MTSPPRPTSVRAWFGVVPGLGVLVSGIITVTRRDRGEGGWILDSVWMVVALAALITNADTLLERY